MQYTIRGIPKDVDKALRSKAKAEGKTLNQKALEAFIAATGVGGSKRKRRDLSKIAGSWRDDPEFDRLMKEQDQIDPEL